MKTQKTASLKDGSPLQKKAHFLGTVTFADWISANIPYKDTYKFMVPQHFVNEFTQEYPQNSYGPTRWYVYVSILGSWNDME